MIAAVATAPPPVTRYAGPGPQAFSTPPEEAGPSTLDVVRLSVEAQNAAASRGSEIQITAAIVQANDGADSRRVFEAVQQHARNFDGGMAASVRAAAGVESTVGANLKAARAFAAYRQVQAQWDGTESMIQVRG